MLGTLAVAGGLASSIVGGIKGRKAAREQDRLIAEQEKKNQEWYNRNYYQNYLDSTEAKAAMKRVEESLRKRREEAAASAAVMGSTPEAVLAEEQAGNELLADTATNLAGQATARKANADAVNMQNQQSIMAAKMGQRQADEAGAGQVMQNGLGILGTALSMKGEDWMQKLEDKKKEKAAGGGIKMLGGGNEWFG